MNPNDSKYAGFALVREMLQTPRILSSFNFEVTKDIAETIRSTGRLFLTGEGSSRIFPAKSFIAEALCFGLPLQVATEGSTQAMEYDLGDWVVFGGSNSGQTKELILLLTQLGEQGHSKRFGVTANAGTRIETVTEKTLVLGCGKEAAVAATKSVVEQALTYRSLLHHITDTLYATNREKAGELAEEVLQIKLDDELVRQVADASMIYFAGRNNGVAEELTLKTNEIARKKCDFLEGTYILHGIEEIMNPEDVVVLVDPFPSEWAAIKKNLVDNIGMTVIAIAPTETPFPTIRIPALHGYDVFLQLLAGWNLLVDVGLKLGIDLDKPRRARKVGNAVDD